jgi:hypothetical protein
MRRRGRGIIIGMSGILVERRRARSLFLYRQRARFRSIERVFKTWVQYPQEKVGTPVTATKRRIKGKIQLGRGGKVALLDEDYRRMPRSPFAYWITVSDGNTKQEVLVYDNGTHYFGYVWPLPKGAYLLADGLPGFGDNQCKIWPKTKWVKVSGTIKE